MRDAIRAGADCFVTGEFHYHDYFENDGMLLAELGHYQSEQYTVDLLGRILERALPGLQVVLTSIDTNPIQYDAR
jgi:putative NIF3 family GTP cyclohydrolase 1 type 2